MTHATGVILQQCRSCGGAFLSRKDLIKIEQMARQRTSRGKGSRATTAEIARSAYSEGRASIRCPACDSETGTNEWSFATLVFVDPCGECDGVWVDGGELEAIERTAWGG